jgi:hypothetical protein
MRTLHVEPGRERCLPGFSFYKTARRSHPQVGNASSLKWDIRTVFCGNLFRWSKGIAAQSVTTEEILRLKAELACEGNGKKIVISHSNSGISQLIIGE